MNLKSMTFLKLKKLKSAKKCWIAFSAVTTRMKKKKTSVMMASRKNYDLFEVD